MCGTWRRRHTLRKHCMMHASWCSCCMRKAETIHGMTIPLDQHNLDDVRYLPLRRRELHLRGGHCGSTATPKHSRSAGHMFPILIACPQHCINGLCNRAPQVATSVPLAEILRTLTTGTKETAMLQNQKDTAPRQVEKLARGIEAALECAHLKSKPVHLGCTHAECMDHNLVPAPPDSNRCRLPN